MNTGFDEPTEVVVDEEDAVEVTASPNALMQISEAEVNRQILTARAYPRSITGFRQQMRELVTFDAETAQSCLYAYKRGGKLIEGPSINFAVSAMQAWGNIRTGSMITEVGEDFVTAQGFFWDMEKNMAVAFQVLRRISSNDPKSGQKVRYNDDMIMVTGNAAGSIALRNAILKGIPKPYWSPSYQAARKCAVGEFENFSQKREDMLKAFIHMNVDKEQIFGLLGVKGIEDVTYEHLMFLAGVHNSIKEGGEKAEDVFALENMQNADQVRPNRPARSMFTRDKPADKPSDKPSADKPDPGKAGEAMAAAANTEKQAAESAQVQQPTQADLLAKTREDERIDLVKDLYAQLEKLKTGKSVRNVVDLCDTGTAAGVFDEAEQARWEADCQAASDAVRAAIKTNIGKGTK